MCSTPKGRGGRPHHSSAVNGVTSNMSAAEYSSMVQRANESYERRQQELAEIRAARKLSQQRLKPHAQHQENTGGLMHQFNNWLKHLFHSHSAQPKH